MDPHLYRAISKGKVTVLEQSRSTALLHTTHQNNTTLHVAVQCEKKDCVEEILKRCPSLLLNTNMEGETALHIAARQGLSDIAKLLIDSSKRLGEEDVEGGENEAVVKQLVRMANKYKDTALHEAARNNYIDVIKLLTEVDPAFEYFANNAGETPLYLAVRSCDAVKQILDTCPYSSHGGPKGRTILHQAVIIEAFDGFKDGNISDITRVLLQVKPLLLKEADNQGRTPLHYAAHFNQDEYCDLLLQTDVSVAYIQDQYGMSPLHVAAARHYNNHVIGILIHHSPDCLEMLDHEGRNFLHIAALHGAHFVMRKALKIEIINKACINQRDNDGNTPLHLSAFNKAYGIIKVFAEDGRMNVTSRNNENLNILDILAKNSPEHFDDDYREWKSARIALLNAGASWTGSPNQREVDIKTEKIGKSGPWLKDDKNEKQEKREKREKREKERQIAIEKMHKVSDSHLVVAALIATVTFTVGFALPGDYGNEGKPNLLGKATFKAFVISNTIAMLLSSLAVLFHFVVKLISDKDIVDDIHLRAFACTFYAIVTMVLAFVTGTYAVLAPSPALAITTCVIGGSFYLLCLKPFSYVMNEEVIGDPVSYMCYVPKFMYKSVLKCVRLFGVEI